MPDSHHTQLEIEALELMGLYSSQKTRLGSICVGKVWRR